MEAALWKVVEALFPKTKVVVDPLHVIADSNKRMDEARRMEQDVNRKRKVKMSRRMFLMDREKLGEEKKPKGGG